MMPFKLTYWKENFKFGGYHFNLGGTIYYMVELPWWLSWEGIYLQCRRPEFNPWVGKIPWKRAW